MPRKSLSDLIRRYLPWLLVVLIFGYMFDRIDFYDFVSSFGRVTRWFFLLVVVYGLMYFSLDAFVFTLMFRDFGTEVRYREMLPARGSTLILNVLHYMAGQGGFALVMNRWKKITMARSTGIVFWSMYIDYFSLLLFCLVGAFRMEGVDLANFFSGGQEGDLVRFVTISWIVFFLVLAFYRLLLPRQTFRFDGLRRNEFAYPFVVSPSLRYAKFIALKMPQYLTTLTLSYLAIMAFGLKVPFLELMAMLPLVWLIASVPVTPLRLGTTQAAAVWLVAPIVTNENMSQEEIEASVFAFNMLWEIALLTVRFIMGAIFIKWMPREVWKGFRPKGGPEDALPA